MKLTIVRRGQPQPGQAASQDQSEGSRFGRQFDGKRTYRYALGAVT